MPIITTPIDFVLQSAITTNTRNSFGNQILYDMCKSGNMLNPEELADEIWLIGRSYAASTERRFYKRVGNLTPGRGTGDYFNHIGSYLALLPAFQTLVSKIKTIAPLNFNCSTKDFSNLCLSVQCVEELNELIKAASENFDRTYNKGIIFSQTKHKNQISFCSKFLHFQEPESFFIIDSVTLETGKQLFSTRCRSTRKLYNVLIGKSENVAFDNELSCVFKNAPKCKTTSSALGDYKEHVKRSYALGVILKKIEKMYSISKSSNVTYPRLTDIIFQKVL